MDNQYVLSSLLTTMHSPVCLKALNVLCVEHTGRLKTVQMLPRSLVLPSFPSAYMVL